MKRPLRLALVVGVLTSLAAGAAPSAQSGRSFLWRVQGSSGVLYLAGSVHALGADAYPLPDAYQRAFDASDTLVEELDLNQSSVLAAAGLLLTKGMYTDGRTFDTVVSKETVELVQGRLKDIPLLSMDLIRSMKPWAVMLMVSAMQVQMAGLDPQLGLDTHFYDKAVSAGKTVIGLETAEYQIDRFDKMPDAVQEKLLRSALAEMESSQKQLGAIVGAWKRGDAASLERMLLADLRRDATVYNSLVVERNRNWMPQLEMCLARAKPCFVVVGAAHLVGPDGLLRMLQQKGYRLEQM